MAAEAVEAIGQQEVLDFPTPPRDTHRPGKRGAVGGTPDVFGVDEAEYAAPATRKLLSHHEVGNAEGVLGEAGAPVGALNLACTLRE